MSDERQGQDRLNARKGIETADEWGERLGRSLGGLYQSIRNLGEQAATGSADSGQGGGTSDESPTERAETLVTQAEQKLGEYASLASYGIRRIAARAKEEYEDIMAEAQAKREAQKQNTGPE